MICLLAPRGIVYICALLAVGSAAFRRAGDFVYRVGSAHISRPCFGRRAKGLVISMKVRRSPLAFILLAALGAVIGSALWSLITPILPAVLANAITIGSTSGPWTLDLNFITLSFGIVLRLNIGGVIGLITALVIYSRM